MVNIGIALFIQLVLPADRNHRYLVSPHVRNPRRLDVIAQVKGVDVWDRIVKTHVKESQNDYTYQHLSVVSCYVYVFFVDLICFLLLCQFIRPSACHHGRAWIPRIFSPRWSASFPFSWPKQIYTEILNELIIHVYPIWKEKIAKLLSSITHRIHVSHVW